jgi:hypothetical protein
MVQARPRKGDVQMTAMTQQELDFIRSILPASADSLRQAIDQRLTDYDCQHFLSQGKLVLKTTTTLVDESVVNAFRSTDWCIREYRVFPTDRELLVSIIRKHFLPQTPEICFHVTPAENADGILRLGIRPGIRVGQLNNTEYPEGAYFVHAALSLGNALAWAHEIIPNRRLACFPFRAAEAGYRLYLDTAAGNKTAFVVDAPEVSAKYLNSPSFHQPS